jgi:hypothetical protein
MSDIETEWTLNASLTRLSSYRKCSRHRILGHSAQAISWLRIGGTTKCSGTARGFGFGSGMASVAEVRPKAGLGFKASAAFPVLKPIAMLAFRAGIAPAEVQRLSRPTVTPIDTGRYLRSECLATGTGESPADLANPLSQGSSERCHHQKRSFRRRYSHEASERLPTERQVLESRAARGLLIIAIFRGRRALASF